MKCADASDVPATMSERQSGNFMPISSIRGQPDTGFRRIETSQNGLPQTELLISVITLCIFNQFIITPI